MTTAMTPAAAGRWKLAFDGLQEEVPDAVKQDGEPYDRAFYWTQAAGMVEIVGAVIAFGVNAQGTAVGRSTTHAIVYRPDTGLQQLPTPKGMRTCVARDINAAGTIVGWCKLKGSDADRIAAVAWYGGTRGYRAIRLDALLSQASDPRLKGRLGMAMTITDQGDILVRADDAPKAPIGKHMAVILTPRAR